eukprot:scaffold9132_cov112-Isochrysis_galbana.AAC.2
MPHMRMRTLALESARLVRGGKEGGTLWRRFRRGYRRLPRWKRAANAKRLPPTGRGGPSSSAPQEEEEPTAKVARLE